MAIIKALIVLALICVPGASAKAAPTLVPAQTVLTEDKLCVGVSMKSHRLACVVKTAMACFAGSAVTGEATFHTCFAAGVLTENCLAKAKNDDKYHCVGLEISDDLLPCIEEVAWNCYDGSMVYTTPTFVACFLVKVVTCSLE